MKIRNKITILILGMFLIASASAYDFVREENPFNTSTYFVKPKNVDYVVSNVCIDKCNSFGYIFLEKKTI